MSKYQLIHELCESRIFRHKASIEKFSQSQHNTLFYSILLSAIVLALDPKTNSWARKYASRASAFGNFDYFRPSGNDLYILTYIAQNVTKSISKAQARSLLRIYKGLARGDVESKFAEQTLIRLERGLGIKDARLRNARRVITHWSKTPDPDQKQTVTNLHRIVRLHAKIAEVLPYLIIASKDEPGHFGKMTIGKAAVALAGAGLAGLALGLRYDPNKRGWRVFRDSVVFDGKKLLTEDRPTQLFHIVQNLNHHPDIERIVSVHYIADGISAFVRDTQGNAYEIEIRPAPFAKGHEEKRSVKEGIENPLAKFGITALSDIIEQGDIGYSDNPVYMYWVEVPNRGSSGYFSFIEDAYALAREDYPYLIDDEHDDIHEVKEEREDDPECWDCYDTGYSTEQHWEETVNVPCDCKNSAEFRNRFVQEDVWQWQIVGILNENGVIIALTPDDLYDHNDDHMNGKHDSPYTEEEVQKYLKDVCDRYDVEIVDDFLKYTGQDGEIS